MSVFFSALVGLVILEIRVSFPDFIDDGAVSFPFLCFSISLFLLCHTEHLYVSCRSYLACVCHSLGL